MGIDCKSQCGRGLVVWRAVRAAQQRKQETIRVQASFLIEADVYLGCGLTEEWRAAIDKIDSSARAKQTVVVNVEKLAACLDNEPEVTLE